MRHTNGSEGVRSGKLLLSYGEAAKALGRIGRTNGLFVGRSSQFQAPSPH